MPVIFAYFDQIYDSWLSRKPQNSPGALGNILEGNANRKQIWMIETDIEYDDNMKLSCASLMALKSSISDGWLSQKLQNSPEALGNILEGNANRKQIWMIETDIECNDNVKLSCAS